MRNLNKSRTVFVVVAHISIQIAATIISAVYRVLKYVNRHLKLIGDDGIVDTNSVIMIKSASTIYHSKYSRFFTHVIR